MHDLSQALLFLEEFSSITRYPFKRKGDIISPLEEIGEEEAKKAIYEGEKTIKLLQEILEKKYSAKWIIKED